MIEINKVYNIDCIVGMKLIDDNSIDSIVTDPPYELGFMGKSWDNSGIANSVEMWKEAYRVLKPGGYLLSFGGTRTYHRMASAIEDAGFEIRDMINWTYGSGFPKSLNIGKAVDKLQGNEREDLGKNPAWRKGNGDGATTSTGWAKPQRPNKDKGTSEWEGWGTALKPAHEPIVVARKPLAEKSVAENVLKYGTGGINIDESRIGTDQILTCGGKKGGVAYGDWKEKINEYHQGRFPANVIHDGSPEVLKEFEKAGVSKGGKRNNIAIRKEDSSSYGGIAGQEFSRKEHNDSGTPARFFKSCEFELEDAPSFIYQAKASKSERNEGCDELESNVGGSMNGTQDQTLLTGSGNIRNNITKNNHPTVKPLKLMEYLVKLVTPKDGVCLDPFMGSGTTAVACKKNGFKYLGFEKEAEYIEIINARLDNIKQNKL